MRNGMAGSPLILAIDAGSFSVRCTLFALSGAVRAYAQRRIDQTLPAPDWHEQDAAAIWSALLDALRELDAQHDFQRVCAVGLTNQRGTCLLWNRATGAPLGPAIFWSDRRTEPTVAALHAAGYTEFVQTTTGLALHSFYSAPKLRWLIDHLPAARMYLAAGQLAGGTLDSWLLWQLSGGRVHATDYSNAQRTLLFHLKALAWDRELAALFKVPVEILPTITSGCSVQATTQIEALPRLRAPIAAVAGDQTAALVGHGAFVAGAAKCSYGTSIVPLMFCGVESRGAREGLAVIAYTDSGATAYGMGCTIAGGALALQWCCTKLGLFDSVEELVAVAAAAPPDDEVVFVPAFTGLTVPARDAGARAAILGLHPAADRRTIARAALESMAFQVADALQYIAGVSGASVTELHVDGGLARSDLLMQMQADLLGIPVARPAQSELASLGIAYLAALSAGAALDDRFLVHGRGATQSFRPQLDETGRRQRLARWRAGVERAGGWVS